MNWKNQLAIPSELYPLIRSRLETHHHTTYQYADVPYREAAVLIPLFFKETIPHILFTKRTDKVEHHKSQISFPGGAQDKDDANLRVTALRETMEEVGIKKEDIFILGHTDKFLTNTNFMVTPYVGHFTYPYPYHVNPEEITRLIEVPLEHLLRPEVFAVKKWERNGVLWDLHYYYYQDEIIWGVTGFLLSNFLKIVFDLPHLP